MLDNRVVCVPDVIPDPYLLFYPVFRIRIHMFLGLMDPDPLVRGMDPDLDPPIIMKK
jgi:hypothetical protein